MLFDIGADRCLFDSAPKLRVGLRKAQVGLEARQGGANRHRGASSGRLRPGAPDRIVSPPPPDGKRRVVDLRQIHDVPPAIPDEPKPAAAVRPSLEDALKVLQVIRKVGERPEEHVEVGAARRCAPAGCVEPQLFRQAPGKRPVRRHAARQQADSRIDSEVAVSGIARDRQYRRYAAAVLGRESPGLQLDALHHVRVEDGEDAAQMKRIEDRNLVEKDQVLVRGSAPDVESRRKIRHRGHARKHLDGTERVRLGDNRDRLEGRGRDLLDGHPRLLLESGPGAAAVGLQRHALKDDCLPFHDDLHLGGGAVDGHLVPKIPEPDQGHAQVVDARLQVAEGEKAEIAAQGVDQTARIRRRVQRSQGACDREAVVGPGPAAQHAGLGRRGPRQGQGEKQRQSGQASGCPQRFRGDGWEEPELHVGGIGARLSAPGPSPAAATG